MWYTESCYVSWSWWHSLRWSRWTSTGLRCMLLGALGVLGNDACSEVSLKITSGWNLENMENWQISVWNKKTKVSRFQLKFATEFFSTFFKVHNQKKSLPLPQLRVVEEPPGQPQERHLNVQSILPAAPAADGKCCKFTALQSTKCH